MHKRYRILKYVRECLYEQCKRRYERGQRCGGKKKRYVDMLLMMPDETMKDSGSTKTEEMKREKKES